MALPIYYANMPVEVPTEGESPTIDGIAKGMDVEVPEIKSIAENLNLHRIGWGVGSLLSYAALAVYLNSPKLRRQFK